MSEREIAESIWEEAERAIGAGIADRLTNTEIVARAIQAAGEKAKAAERERCAKIAEDFTTQRKVQLEVEYWVNDTHQGDATIEEFVPYIGKRLASSIRQGTAS